MFVVGKREGFRHSLITGCPRELEAGSLEAGALCDRFGEPIWLSLTGAGSGVGDRKQGSRLSLIQHQPSWEDGHRWFGWLLGLVPADAVDHCAIIICGLATSRLYIWTLTEH